jgi:hypothetical protein
MELAKKTYIKGENAPEKLENLMRVAEEFHHGNWSAMVLEALIKRWDLDPKTCAPLKGKHHKS